ncbi:hypothetical protein PoB_001086700 [Plakobranchus ocellatus]|uniref:Uncharacterized protein n=1 Tax=Plakobranchus ocellatus TaxID=259542 RepID=A0AAV3YN34_9GAST|nr:hypothetical protein PoB_001086700 [Plakobranchus ocellatus]
MATADWGMSLRYPWWGIMVSADWGTCFRYPWWGILGTVDWSAGFCYPWWTGAAVLVIESFSPQLISSAWDIADGVLEHWLVIDPVGDIGDIGLEHWLFISLVGDIGDGGIKRLHTVWSRDEKQQYAVLVLCLQGVS